MISIDNQKKTERAAIDTQIAHGAIAGFVATMPMTIMMAFFQSRLPLTQRYDLPPGQITRKVIEHKLFRRRVKKPQHSILTMIAHFGYGTSIGILYELLFASKSARQPFSRLIILGNVVGLGVWAVNYVGLIPSLNILPSATKMPAKRNLLMIGAHFIWGSVLVFVSNALHKSM